jgi:DNA replication protein DnaC
MSETTKAIDAQRLTLILNDLRLPAIKQAWPEFVARADTEAWPAARLLATLAEHEIAERDRRRIERHLLDARLPPGKTIDAFAFDAVPMISKARVLALCAGDLWLDQGANLILFGPPGGGKSHLAAAIGLALIENGWRVLFTRTSDLVQKLQIARRELALESAIARLDKYHLLILDDLAYVAKDQAETSVLFELISARYERRSLLITANQPFGEWGKIFPDPAMTLAAVDRLVHHATIFEMNVDSYRRKSAVQRRTGPGRPPTRATIRPTRRPCQRQTTPTNVPKPRPHFLILIVALLILIVALQAEAWQKLVRVVNGVPQPTEQACARKAIKAEVCFVTTWRGTAATGRSTGSWRSANHCANWRWVTRRSCRSRSGTSPAWAPTSCSVW